VKLVAPLAILPVLAAPAAGRRAAPEPRSATAAAAELRRMSQELLDAVAPGEVAVWRRYLHDRFVHLDENGFVDRREGEDIRWTRD
jgi:hypothetical protein